MAISPGDETIRRNRAATTATLALILIGAATLRLGGLAAESLWWDEVLTTYSARAPFWRVIGAVRNHENAPPLYFILMNLWAKGFGMSDVALRLPSALIGIATVALLWRVGTELFDSTVGLTAGALLAVSPIHIAYSQEARMYALLLLLLTLNLWSVVRMLRGGSTRWQVVFVLTAALAMLTHTFATFTLIAVNLFWLLRFVRRGETGVTLRRWALLNAMAILLFGPWLPATLEVARMGLPWLTKSTTLFEAFVGYAGTLPAIPMIGLALLAIGWAVRGRDDRVLLLVLLTLVPILGPIAYGPFTTRYGIAALIGLTMLAAFGASRLGRWACAGLVLFAAIGWATTSTLGHARYLNYTPKADLRAAVQYVLEHRTGDDMVVPGSRGFWHVLERYTDGTGLRLVERIDMAEDERHAQLWFITPPSAAEPPAGYETAYPRASFDGVVVLLLRRRIEPATTTGVPSTYPRN